MTMILMLLLGLMVTGCALVVTLAALSRLEAEREIRQMATRRVPVMRHSHRPGR